MSLFKPAPKPRRRPKRRGDIDMTDEGKEERGYAAAIFGNPLNAEVYDPHESQIVPETGAWAMIRRSLPPIERELDKQITPGRIFWVEREAGTDDDGFNQKTGWYKVRCLSPFGEVCLWPYEYAIMDTAFIISAWQEGALTFHPLNVSDVQFTDQLFYCLSRGISRADAVVMALGTITGPIGWFEPADEISNFVKMFESVGAGITDENRKRRSKSRRTARTSVQA